MNGVATAHRVLGTKTQTVVATISNTAVSWIRNGLINLFNDYLEAVKPSTVSETVDFIMDNVLITPSAKSTHSITFPVRVYFHVTVNDSINQIAEEYMLYADINTASTPDLPGYKQMNDAFKDAQYQKTGITKHELNDSEVFVDTIICKP